MTVTAMLFDLIEFLVDFIPFLGQVLAFIVDVLAMTTFYIWFLIKGLKLGSPKAAARFWTTSLVELFPLPLIDFCLTTIGIILMIKATWDEDSGKQGGIAAVTTAAQVAKGGVGTKPKGIPVVSK